MLFLPRIDRSAARVVGHAVHPAVQPDERGGIVATDQLDPPQLDRFGIIGQRRPDDAVATDLHRARIRRDRHRRAQRQPAIVRQQAIGIDLHRAAAPQQGLPARPHQLDEAIAFDREVERPSGPLHLALLVDGQLAIEADAGVGRSSSRPGRGRHVARQVGKAHPRALEPGGVHIGDIIGQRFQCLLLGAHRQRADAERVAHRPPFPSVVSARPINSS